MSESPYVSIIVPCYKVEHFIGRCVDSVLGQSFTDWELILVDDGSPDKTGEVCDIQCKRDSRIKVIHQENKGVSAARNAGLVVAKGKYYCFIDSDDWVEPDYLKNLVETQRRHNADLTISGIILYEKGSVRKDTVPECSYSVDDIIEVFSTHEYFFMMRGPVCKLFDSSIIRQNNLLFPTNIHFGEDTVFVLEYCLHIRKIAFSSAANYHYERKEGSLVTGSYSHSDCISQINTFNRIHERWYTILDSKESRIPYFDDTMYILFSRLINASFGDVKIKSLAAGFSMITPELYDYPYPRPTTIRQWVFRTLMLNHRCFFAVLLRLRYKLRRISNDIACQPQRNWLSIRCPRFQ